jgi:hypothetical protein
MTDRDRLAQLTFRRVDQYTLYLIATEGTPGDGTEDVGTYLVASLPKGAQPGSLDEEEDGWVRLADADLLEGFEATQGVVSSASGTVLHPDAWKELKGHAFAAGLAAAFGRNLESDAEIQVSGKGQP